MTMTARDIKVWGAAADDREARALEREVERERARREARRRLDAEERRTQSAPEILTLRERLTRPRPVLVWRIQDWQPRHTRVMLTAAFKAGKTTLVGGLVRSLVDGDMWLDRDLVAPIAGVVAVVDTEMSASQLDEWLRTQRIHADERVVIIPLRGCVAAFDLVNVEVRASWATRLRALHVEYLILDCLRPVLDALGLDEHGEAGRFLVAFDALLSEAGISEACIVHHMGHTSERARGDSRLRDWPDCEWRVVRQDEDPASPRFISAYGRDVDVPEIQLAYDDATRRLTIAGGSRRDAKARAALVDVVAILRGQGALSGRAIKAALDGGEHARDTIEAALVLGVRIATLQTEAGPRRSKLYRVSECPALFDECPADIARECPAVSIDTDTHRALDRSVSVRSDSEATS
jgi:hypothetical protein